MADDIAMNITSKIVALSSAVAFALQIALALLMLRYFSPEEVGTFSVISQIGFFWTTLALSQAPLQLLANQGVSVFADARQAWFSSLKRFVWLSPVAAMAVWCSNFSFVSALLWALLLSLFQLTWMLAQSMRLRIVGIWALVGVRVLPPLIALLVVVIAVSMKWNGSALLAAALVGYATGAVWLLHGLVNSRQIPQNPSHLANASVSGDNRAVTLRMAHSLADALLATAVLVVWQRLYGSQETGLMAAPLRVMGFVPAVVHIAWAQVLLAQPQDTRTNPLWVGLGGFACVALLGVVCAAALEIDWLEDQWQGVCPYLFPLVLWQGSACLVAAFSQTPFETNSIQKYSYLCISIAILQCLILCVPIVFPTLQISRYVHIELFGFISSLELLALFYWLQRISLSPTGKKTKA